MDGGTLESLNIKMALNVQLMVTQLQPTDGLVLIRRAQMKDLRFYWMAMTRLSNVQRPTCLEVKGRISRSPKILVRPSMILFLFTTSMRIIIVSAILGFYSKRKAIVMVSILSSTINFVRQIYICMSRFCFKSKSKSKY